MRRLRAAVAGACAVALCLAGCTPSAVSGLARADDVTAPSPTPTEAPPEAGAPQVPPPSPPKGPSACPTGGDGPGASAVSFTGASERADVGGAQAPRPLPPGRARPWKDRPVVRLCFDVPKDRRVVRGTESVEFTPDRRVCELVFRAWPNKPDTARSGSRLDVTAAAVRGRMVTPKVESAGAPPGHPGTLIRVPVKGCVRAGQPVTVDLAFVVTLGADGDERVGYSSEERTAWLATAYPLLAWQRGRGWATDPAVNLFGETATSEEFRLASLEVVAPRGDDVLGTGQERGIRPSTREGSVVHQFSANAVRDVTLTVGRLDVAERDVDGVRVHVGAPVGTRQSAAVWADATVAAVRSLSAYLGPFPYDDLWVTVAPDVPTGIELPGAIQFGDVNPETYPQLVPHEVAHMWFYGLVGNNQARDPWLDESFAEYAEVLVNGEAALSLNFRAPPRVRNQVGQPMAWYAALHNPDLYGAGVYRQGGAMLHRARRAVGPATFDRLLRAYVDRNAHQIATDDDVVRAFAGAPQVVKILRSYGALSR